MLKSYFFITGMMLYGFIKKDDNVVRVGVETSVPAEMQEKLMPYSQDGYVLAMAEDYDQQVIKGAQAGMIPDPALAQSEPAAEVAPAAEAAPAPEQPAA